jgi:hypothetical protein
MKRFHLVIGLMAMLLMTKQAGALNEYVAWTAPEQLYATGYLPRMAMDEPDSANSGVGNAAGTALAWGNGYDTAIEVRQGGQDGGGALWYTMATKKLSKNATVGLKPVSNWLLDPQWSVAGI